MSETMRHLDFPGLSPFYFDIKYSETDRLHTRQLYAHTHGECEIYLNLSSEVSFMVENHIYPLTRGDVILARPGEYHHCIYHSDARHRFYWILFSCEGNRDLLEPFFGDAHVNFVSPPDALRKELIELCRHLHDDELSPTERYCDFFRMLYILREGAVAQHAHEQTLPGDLADMLAFIAENITAPLHVSDIARRLHLSESSVERKFYHYLNISPASFIRKKKLMAAAALLRRGESVLSAGMSVGYTDSSHFIKLFREYYGVTPLQYKKGLIHSAQNKRHVVKKTK